MAKQKAFVELEVIIYDAADRDRDTSQGGIYELPVSIGSLKGNTIRAILPGVVSRQHGRIHSLPSPSGAEPFLFYTDLESTWGTSFGRGDKERRINGDTVRLQRGDYLSIALPQEDEGQVIQGFDEQQTQAYTAAIGQEGALDSWVSIRVLDFGYRQSTNR